MPRLDAAGPQTKEARSLVASESEPKRQRVDSGDGSDAIVIGDTELHSSHTLVHKRGIAVCIKCCAFASAAPRKLVSACSGRPCPPSKYVREVLARISSGRTPRAAVPWALEAPSDWVLLRPGLHGAFRAAGPAAALVRSLGPSGRG